MSLRLAPYAAYRDSDIPWISSLPDHWASQPLWALSRIRDEKNAGGLGLLSVFLDRGVIPYAEGGGQVHAPSLDLSNYQIVHPGDLVLNNQQAWRGSVGVSQLQGIISPAYVVLATSSRLTARFANYLFRAGVLVDQYVLASRGVGTIQRQLHLPALRLVRVPVPPPDEQCAIARYLANADQRINRLIRAKRRMIELLNEQKQAIVHRAVTRGLDPNVPLKPCGIDWLGDIPDHWGITRSKRLFTVRRELARPDDVQLSATQAYGVIAQSEFEEKVARRVVKISMHLEKRRHVERDDFVISMRSFQGGLERAWADGAIRSSYVVLKPKPSADVGYFSYLLKSPGYIRALQATAGFIRDGQDLTFDDFCRVDLPLVPLAEQRAIAAHVSAETAQTAAAIARFIREIGLLREYRTRLIADVVTGKLDVRGVDLPPLDDDGALDEIDTDDDADADVLDDEPNEVDA